MFTYLLAIALTCGPVDTCGDVGQSLGGWIGGSAITIDWDTDDENTDVAFYIVKRYDCYDPLTCSTIIATIMAGSSCASESYEVLDDPPAPASDWTYSVEVYDANNLRKCAHDVIPQ